jgi:hypothetical protein
MWDLAMQRSSFIVTQLLPSWIRIMSARMMDPLQLSRALLVLLSSLYHK